MPTLCQRTLQRAWKRGSWPTVAPDLALIDIDRAPSGPLPAAVSCCPLPLTCSTGQGRAVHSFSNPPRGPRQHTFKVERSVRNVATVALLPPQYRLFHSINKSIKPLDLMTPRQPSRIPRLCLHILRPHSGCLLGDHPAFPICEMRAHFDFCTLIGCWLRKPWFVAACRLASRQDRAVAPTLAICLSAVGSGARCQEEPEAWDSRWSCRGTAPVLMLGRQRAREMRARRCPGVKASQPVGLRL